MRVRLDVRRKERKDQYLRQKEIRNCMAVMPVSKLVSENGYDLIGLAASNLFLLLLFLLCATGKTGEKRFTHERQLTYTNELPSF